MILYNPEYCNTQLILLPFHIANVSCLSVSSFPVYMWCIHNIQHKLLLLHIHRHTGNVCNWSLEFSKLDFSTRSLDPLCLLKNEVLKIYTSYKLLLNASWKKKVLKIMLMCTSALLTRSSYYMYYELCVFSIYHTVLVNGAVFWSLGSGMF